MRTQYYWDKELAKMKKTMNHQEAALSISGFDFSDNDGTFECNVCGETLSIDCMVAVVRSDVPVCACLDCADEESLPLV